VKTTYTERLRTRERCDSDLQRGIGLADWSIQWVRDLISDFEELDASAEAWKARTERLNKMGGRALAALQEIRNHTCDVIGRPTSEIGIIAYEACNDIAALAQASRPDDADVAEDQRLASWQPEGGKKP